LPCHALPYDDPQGQPSATKGRQIKAEAVEGAIAPDFDLETDGGGRVKLSALKGKKVVLYFYPKDDTSGCTLEAVNFTALAGDFKKAGAVVVGVSPDTCKSHDKFKKKHNLSVVLAADPEKQAIEGYGVWVEKSMYGRKYMGVERSTFLIDAKGRIAKAWHKVKVPGHAEAVLEAAKEL
jgi:peroxiredoxin Q/BCP